MNDLERHMVDLLVDMRERFHVVSVKAEFEAEGTRMEEAMRLKEVATRAGLDLTIKVGGCEAIKDMYEAASLGTRYLVGPMVESAFALRKFLRATRTAFPADLHDQMDFLVNVETITACRSFDEMLKIPEIGDLAGVVIGRHDLSESIDLPLSQINGERVLELSLEVAAKAKAAGLHVVVGGAVSVHSKPFFKRFPAGHLDRFETRKVVFACPGALDNPEEAFLKAVAFEIDWLKNKRSYYSAIDRESMARLEVMEGRYRDAIAAIERR